MDPLSDILSLLRPRHYLAAALDLGAPWSVQFPDQNGGIKCNVVVSGEAWLQVDGVEAPVRVQAGDSFLLPSGRPFRIASDLDLIPTPAAEVFVRPRLGGIVRWNGGGDFLVVSTRFGLEGCHAGLLLGLLPPIVHIGRDGEEAGALRGSVERMLQELRDGRPGSSLVVRHLAHMILLQALRLHLADTSADNVGWLYALRDRQIGASIAAMHERPAHRWTLEELAGIAGMSRSVFAEKFRRLVGWTPIDYLTRWRMLSAADRLENTDEAVGAVALSLGYESESAFSKAFKKTMGESPRRYARRGELASAAE